MKTFKANLELAEILLQNGFIDFTLKSDQIKGKRFFKTSKSSRKGLYFDYINIRVINYGFDNDTKFEISEKDLKSILFFFKISSQDYKEIDSDGKFSFNEVPRRLDVLKHELELLTSSNKKNFRRINKINRILNIYDGVN